MSWIKMIIFALLITSLGCGQKDGDQQEKDITERMAEEHEGDRPIANEASMYKPSEPVDGKWVNYAMVDGRTVKGYLAQPQGEMKDSEPLPGLIVIHEWWGLNDNIEMMTQRLAGEGYNALAVDLYNGDTASTSDQARKLMSRAMQDKQTGVSNLEQAHEFLTDSLGAPRTGVIGWCFGGGWSLQAALAMPDQIDATVIYYGELVTDPQQLKKLNMPILGNFGSEDHGIPPEKVNEFKKVLGSLGKTADLKIYEGANHAFANPSGTRYNKEAAADAWKRTVKFFANNLK